MLDGRMAGGHERIGGNGACLEQEMEIDYVTQMEHEQETIIGWVPSIHYDVKKSFSILTTEGLERFKRFGEEGAHCYNARFLAVTQMQRKQEALHHGVAANTMAHTSSMPAIPTGGRLMMME